MNNDLSGFLCLGSICLLPVVMFVLGLLVGGNRLPFRIRVEKNTQLARRYEVDDGTPEWK